MEKNNQATYGKSPNSRCIYTQTKSPVAFHLSQDSVRSIWEYQIHMLSFLSEEVTNAHLSQVQKLAKCVRKKATWEDINKRSET